MDFYIIFEGIIDKDSTTKFYNAITQAKLQPNVKKIIILFSSLGGSIYEGFLLASVIHNSNIPISIHAFNHIDSIGNVIYLSAQERTSESYAKFYLHGASQAGNFDEQGMIDALSAIVTNNSRIAYFISENSNIPLKKVEKMMKTGTTISAQDALKYQIVHAIGHIQIPSSTSPTEIIYIN